MARFQDLQKALALRKQGKSYSQIKKILKVSKGTLSYWLRKYPLSKERIRELRDCNEQRIERFRESMRKKRESRLEKIYNEQKKDIRPLNKKELFLAGLFLYWGEGSKTHRYRLAISNTDPSVIKFFIYWIRDALDIPKDKIRVALHLYQDMSIDKEINFWSKKLNIPCSHFIRPYIKKSSIKKINHKGGFGHGTCNAYINDTGIAEKILMSIKALRELYVMIK